VITDNANADGKMNSRSPYRRQLHQQEQEFKQRLSTMATTRRRGIQATVQRQREKEFKEHLPTTAMPAGTGIQERMV
jgi:hypothetical protein